MNVELEPLQVFYENHIENWDSFSRLKVREQYLDLISFQIHNRLSILDVGCGVGFDSQIISDRLCALKIEDYDALGIDFCNKAIELSNRKIESGKISDKWRFELNELFKFKPNSLYDIVICSMVIMHYEDVNDFFKTLSSFLNKNGQLLLVTNNPYLVSQEFHLAYTDEKSYNHVLSIEPGRAQVTTPKYHHSLGKYFYAAKQSHLHLESYKEILYYDDKTRMFNDPEKNTFGYPNFLALHFIKKCCD